MQNQQYLEKAFFEQLKAGDYVDSRYTDDDWKVAKVLSRENKLVSLMYDGYPPGNEQAYINPMRIKPLRAVTTAYTGPTRGIYSMIASIPDLPLHIDTLDTILNSVEPPSAYRITQFLRGELFCTVNMLLMSDMKLLPQEIVVLNNFFIQLVDRIGKICIKVKEYLPDYFDSNVNNKFNYLANYRLATLWSLQQLLHLINTLLSTGQDQPRLLKTYKSELSQQNLYQNFKQYMPVLILLCVTNDINGRWLPTFTRIQISKILIKTKEEQQFLSITYNLKDYLQFYAYWPHVMGLMQSQSNQRKFVQYCTAVLCKNSTFDAKLKSLVVLRRILEKEQKFTVFTVQQVIQFLNTNKVVDALLKTFNPQIFKRYIPILKQTSQQSKKSLTQPQIDNLFSLLQTSHQSQTNLLYQIIVSISEFISIDSLDNIYIDIQKVIDINNQDGIKFVKDFTIKAIKNYNCNRGKGFFGIFGSRKCSGKFGYYGVDMFVREIMDYGGKIHSRNIGFVIGKVGEIFRNQLFQNQRINHMLLCIANIDKKESYGQSVKLLSEIICTYPESAYIGESQKSVLAKLDEKYKLVDTLIKALKPLQKQWANQIKIQSQGLPIPQPQTQKGSKQHIMKVSFDQSIKYCYQFIQQFGAILKYPLQLRHINHLWAMPYSFDFLRKPRENIDGEILHWKRKFYKKLSEENIKGILTEIIKIDENLIPSNECFDAVHELIIAINLNKSLQMTEYATIRYRKLDTVIGIGFYFKFLEKLIQVNRPDWEKGVTVQKNIRLVEKVIRIIFELHLRPFDYEAIQKKCQNWIICLMKVVKATYKDNWEICINSVELFLQLIKGRLAKDINNSAGKLDTIVSYQSREKTITLPKNSTILKLRLQIMQAFKIKTNFQMYNTRLKRQIKFTQQQDFSIYAMGQAIKGPTIILKRINQKNLFPLFQAQNHFMSLIQIQQQFYRIIFGLLQKQDKNNLHAKIWKIIEKVPVNRATKDKIKNCKDFKKANWEQFLLPNRLQQLQYSINIVYGMLGSHGWMEDFKRSSGSAVIEELYLTMLGSDQPLSEKIKINLSKVLLKILEHSSSDSKFEPMNKEEIQQHNYEKISLKLMNYLEIVTEKYEQELASNTVNNTTTKSSIPSIECLNMIMKMLLVSSLKKNCPQIEVLIKFFLHDGILLKVSDLILFKAKNIDTTFFTQDILQKITLNMGLQKSYKFQILKKFIQKYLNYQLLMTKQSTQNYFIFLIDFLHNFDKEQAIKLFEENPQIVRIIKIFVHSALVCDRNLESGMEGQCRTRKESNDQIIHGCLKLLLDTLLYPSFGYDMDKIFNVLLTDYVLVESNPNQSNCPTKMSKYKLKYKKILYEIMKIMVYKKESTLSLFVQKMSPKLQEAEWRHNHFYSWNLQQQKKQKKYFCGLENLAATCYINCLFQQLFMITSFTDRFINVDSLFYKQQAQTNQIYQLQKLLTFLKYGNKKSYTTKQFCESFITYEGVPIDPSVQNDADQFFNALMEKIQSFLKMAGQHQILEETFQGKLSNQLNCEGCPHSSQKIQPFLSIGLNIKNKKTLEEALDGYVEGQILDGDNAYFCEICQKKVRTMKKLCIKQLPNIMVIVLKRFTYNFDIMQKIKINDQLKFPESINMKKYMSQFPKNQQQLQQIKQITNKKENNQNENEDFQYQLRGIVVHSGTSQGGHYYSFVKENTNKWYQYNDQYIEETDYRRIEEDSFGGEEKDTQFKLQKHKNAYILFYQKQKPNPPTKQSLEGEQPFQAQLRELVQTQNRTADFLCIILDQNFIRLCENIGMCGDEKAHRFLILYFHSVLLRDKNKDDYLPNIYRIILTLISDSIELALWFIQQVDDHYIREFLIEAPKLIRYLALGLVIHAIKVANQTAQGAFHKSIKKDKQLIAKIQAQASEMKIQFEKERTVENSIDSHHEKYGKDLEMSKSEVEEKKQEKVEEKNESGEIKKEQQEEYQKKQSQSQQAEQKKEQEQQIIPTILPENQENQLPKATQTTQPTEPAVQQPQTQTQPTEQKSQPTKPTTEPTTESAQPNQSLPQPQAAFKNSTTPPQQNYLPPAESSPINTEICNRVVLDLIPRLVAAVKSKGMNPYAKIFTYLGSVPIFREALREIYYPERVAQIVTGTNNQFFNKIEYACSGPSYIGRQHKSSKDKDLQTNHTFLIQSLRNFPNSIPTETLPPLIQSSQSRPATKSLLYLLTCQTPSPKQCFSTIQSYKQRILDQKHKRQQIQKFMFLIRYYYLTYPDVSSDPAQSVKYACLEALATVIKANQLSYLLMEIVIVEINKIAWKSQIFRSQWVAVVKGDLGLVKALGLWVTQSKRPIFLQRNQEWKRKTANMSYQQKQQAIFQHCKNQQKRTLWMLPASQKQKQASSSIYSSYPSSYPSLYSQKQSPASTLASTTSKKEEELSAVQIHSDLDSSQMGTYVCVGFKMVKIVDRLGVLAKVEDQKGMNRWAVLERTDIDTYADF